MGRPAIEHRNFIPVADLVVSRGRQHDRWRYRKSSEALAVSETLSMPRRFTPGNREIPAVSRSEGRLEREVQGHPRTTSMHAAGKSDEGVVPTNRRRQSPRTGREGLKPEESCSMLGSGTLCPISAMTQKNASVNSTPLPEVGAACGNDARTDLSGGRPARAVPTTPMFTSPTVSLVTAPGADSLYMLEFVFNV